MFPDEGIHRNYGNDGIKYSTATHIVSLICPDFRFVQFCKLHICYVKDMLCCYVKDMKTWP